MALGLLMALTLWRPDAAHAQNVTATINGIITDPGGAVVPNANVVIKDLDRATVRSAKTNESGFYSVSNLPVGRYEVRVMATGFQTSVESPIPLQANQVFAANVHLPIGAETMVVEVTTEAPLLQTDTTDVGTTIDAATNVTLPLASRNYLQLSLLTPGVVTVQPSGFGNGQNVGQVARPEVNGNRFTANSYLLDGMDNNDAGSNYVVYSPQPDALQEFRIITQNAPADFGNYMGGVISASIKSGTNKFHGSAFEFFRNDKLNANEWMNKLVPGSPVPRTKVRWNEYGGSIGGPVLKDKLFFFADYQAERFNFPSTSSLITVFTAKERAGDVSELVAAGKKVIDPLTGQPFPNNVIPQNRLSKAALAILSSSLYPTPINSAIQGNAYNTVVTQTNVDQGDGRLDYAATEKDRFMGRFSYSRLNNPKLSSFNYAYNTANLVTSWNFVTGYTRTLRQNLLNDARVGVNYVQVGQNHTSANFTGDAGSLFSIPGLTSSFLPAMSFSGGFVTGFGTKAAITDNYDTSIQYSDVLNWVHGRHNTRFGFQGWRVRVNGLFNSNNGNSGSLTFGSIFSGSAESNFLLGLPSQVNVGAAGSGWGQRNSIYAGLIQDDWKITDRLTFNLGLRYENHTPFVEARDRQVNWDPQTGNLELPNQNGNNRALYKNYNGYGNYQPRIGIAWQVLTKTTLRGSYGLSSFMEGTGLGLRLPGNPPRAVATSANYSALSYPTTTLDQGFSPIATPAGCNLAGLINADPLCYKGAIIYSWDKHVQPAQSHQWSMFLQQEIWPNATFQIGYVGQATRHLTNAQLLTQGVLQSPGVVAPSPYFANNRQYINQVAYIFGTFAAAHQSYHALQTQLQGRNNRGFSYQVNYTWSRCMTNSQGFFGEGGQSSGPSAWWQNSYDPKGETGACYYNVKGVFSGYATYELPIGRGKHFGTNMNRAADAVVGGWKVNLIPTFRGGFPLTLSSNDDHSGTNSFQNRPDCVAPPRVLHKQTIGNGLYGYRWFDPASYAEPKAGTFGSCSVSSVYGPGQQTIDTSVAKTFAITEHQNVEFRSEFFNTLNHPILDAPSTSGINSSNPNAGTIGQIKTSEGARQIQFALKYNF
ncbi:TonB-dependent receptor domain-containing protein [Terriglobus roseus]|uniref:TonB-dependent receptor domain-containing protein n=1 Tax=Terriglobus roseus TaxID=392734 RepID=UPI0014805D82|nr:TonB-dependent receptor [Terriglobus roseus]